MPDSDREFDLTGGIRLVEALDELTSIERIFSYEDAVMSATRLARRSSRCHVL
jgi:hypothetical protein